MAAAAHQAPAEDAKSVFERHVDAALAHPVGCRDEAFRRLATYLSNHWIRNKSAPSLVPPTPSSASPFLSRKNSFHTVTVADDSQAPTHVSPSGALLTSPSLSQGGLGVGEHVRGWEDDLRRSSSHSLPRDSSAEQRSVSTDRDGARSASREESRARTREGEHAVRGTVFFIPDPPSLCPAPFFSSSSCAAATATATSAPTALHQTTLVPYMLATVDYRSGYIQMPAGTVEEQDVAEGGDFLMTLVRAVNREFKEETGLPIEGEGEYFTGEHFVASRVEQGSRNNVTMHTFHCVVVGGTAVRAIHMLRQHLPAPFPAKGETAGVALLPLLPPCTLEESHGPKEDGEAQEEEPPTPTVPAARAHTSAAAASLAAPSAASLNGLPWSCFSLVAPRAMHILGPLTLSTLLIQALETHAVPAQVREGWMRAEIFQSLLPPHSVLGDAHMPSQGPDLVQALLSLSTTASLPDLAASDLVARNRDAYRQGMRAHFLWLHEQLCDSPVYREILRSLHSKFQRVEKLTAAQANQVLSSLCPHLSSTTGTSKDPCTSQSCPHLARISVEPLLPDRERQMALLGTPLRKQEYQARLSWPPHLPTETTQRVVEVRHLVTGTMVFFPTDPHASDLFRHEKGFSTWPRIWKWNEDVPVPHMLFALHPMTAELMLPEGICKSDVSPLSAGGLVNPSMQVLVAEMNKTFSSITGYHAGADTLHGDHGVYAGTDFWCSIVDEPVSSEPREDDRAGADASVVVVMRHYFFKVVDWQFMCRMRADPRTFFRPLSNLSPPSAPNTQPNSGIAYLPIVPNQPCSKNNFNLGNLSFPAALLLRGSISPSSSHSPGSLFSQPDNPFVPVATLSMALLGLLLHRDESSNSQWQSWFHLREGGGGGYARWLSHHMRSYEELQRHYSQFLHACQLVADQAGGVHPVFPQTPVQPRTQHQVDRSSMSDRSTSRSSSRPGDSQGYARSQSLTRVYDASKFSSPPDHRASNPNIFPSPADADLSWRKNDNPPAERARRGSSMERQASPHLGYTARGGFDTESRGAGQLEKSYAEKKARQQQRAGGDTRGWTSHASASPSSFPRPSISLQPRSASSHRDRSENGNRDRRAESVGPASRYDPRTPRGPAEALGYL